jgi:hypothetical protein
MSGPQGIEGIQRIQELLGFTGSINLSPPTFTITPTLTDRDIITASSSGASLQPDAYIHKVQRIGDDYSTSNYYVIIPTEQNVAGRLLIINNVSTNSVTIKVSSSSIYLNGSKGNVSYKLNGNSRVMFICIDSSHWRTFDS